MKANEFDLLLRRLDEGDESALVDIYNAYGKKIIGVAVSIVGDIQHAQAVLDDVLVLLWNKSKKFNNIVCPDALIYDLARKSACTYYRKYIKKSKRDVSLDDESIADSLIQSYDEGNVDYMLLISKLNDTDREIINRRIFFKSTLAEIAESMNMPEGTLKWRYIQMLHKLTNKITSRKGE